MAVKARLAYVLGSKERVFVEVNGEFYPLSCATGVKIDEDKPGQKEYPLMHVSVADFIVKTEGDTYR